MNIGVPKYVQFLQRIFETDVKTRQFFHKIVSESSDANVQENDFVRKLIIIESEMFFYLTHKLSKNLHWWTVLERYETILALLRCLCKNNFQAMKRYIGQFVPKSSRRPHYNAKNHNYIRIKMNNINFCLNYLYVNEFKTEFI